MKTQCRKWLFLAVASTSLILGIVHPVAAQRPVAPKLLPESTLAVIRVTDAPLLVDRFRATALGQIGQDAKIRPLVSQLYASAQDAFREIEDRVGLPLDQLLSIPQGEICVAFVATPEEQPGVVVVLDVKDQMFKVRKLLDKGEDFLGRSGGSKTTERIGPDEVSIFRAADGNQLFLLEREGALVATSSRTLAQFVLKAWDGNGDRTLADNDKYNAIMSRCAGAVDDPPQVTWFVDPIEVVRRLARGTFAATGLALLPALGLDGVRGAGGSMTFASGDYDGVQHMHLLLDNPRAGVIPALALKSGDTMPEAWVPPDCVSYSTVHWDVYQTFTVAARLYNSLVNEGAFQQEVRTRVSERLGVDFEKELLPALDGRATLVQWVERPVRINSIATLVGLRLRDPQAFKPVMDKVLQKYADRVEKQRFGSVNYWTIRVPQPPMRQNGANLRQPLPCVGIVGDYLLMTDSMAAFQEAVVTSSDPSRGLANSLDFKLIASKIKRQPRGDAPGLVQFNRPEEGLRFWYDLATSDDTKRLLAEQGARNPFFRALDQALKDHPLPPFSALAEYMAPGGGMLVNDETGFHYLTFTLKRK